jgi:hypothetical protein
MTVRDSPTFVAASFQVAGSDKAGYKLAATNRAPRAWLESLQSCLNDRSAFD